MVNTFVTFCCVEDLDYHHLPQTLNKDVAIFFYSRLHTLGHKKRSFRLFIDKERALRLITSCGQVLIGHQLFCCQNTCNKKFPAI